jgi:hypothetical protein
MIENLVYYLANGLIEYERVNVDKKKLVESTSEDFVEFMEEVELDKRYDKKLLFEKFIEIYPDFKTRFSQRTFTRWIRLFANLNKLKFDVRNSGSSKGFVLTKSGA